MSILSNLQNAEKQALLLFDEIVSRQLIFAGKTESQLNKEVHELAFELFAIKKFWHKRIVRAGKNTLLPYRENPPNLILKENDIVFFDFGPVFEVWEADIGKTFVLGDDAAMHKIKKDSEEIWLEGQAHYLAHREEITAAELYAYVSRLAQSRGWKYGNEHAGHLVGKFPHEKLLSDEIVNYIHPKNNKKMSDLDCFGEIRHWILEIHLVDYEKEIGAFYERLV